MSMFRSPDVIIPLLFGLLLSLLILLVFWSVGEEPVWRSIVIALVPLVPGAISACWRVNYIRQPLFKLWYRLRGPNYEVQARGTVWVQSSWSNEKLLDAAFSVAKNWRTDSKVELRISERIVIQSGPRTLSVDVPQQFDCNDSEEEVANKEQSQQDKVVHFHLRGYDSKFSRIDFLLNSEIGPLLEQLSGQMRPQGNSENYSLEVRMGNVNPFLQFYLRDVPGVQVDLFQLRLTDLDAGNKVHVNVEANRLTVSTRSPGALVRAARRYLANPALSNHN